MKPLVVEWAWRMRCMVEDCPCTWEKWVKGRDQSGPPGLPRQDEAKRGWFLHYPPPGSNLPDYFAYCPEHAHLGMAWRAAMTNWNNKRNVVGKVTYTGFVARMKAAVGLLEDPKTATKKKMAEWMTKNPRPTAPWTVCGKKKLTDDNARR